MDNLVNSLVTKSIGLTDQQVVSKLLANPNMNDSQLVELMQSSGISPEQMSRVANIPEGKIAARVAATISPGNSVTLGDTVIAPQYRTTGSGMDEQIGPLEGFAMSKSNGDINYKAPVGTPVQIYSGDGEFVNTVKTKKDLSFFGGMKEMLKDPVVQAAILGVAGGAGVFDGVFAGTGAAGTGAGSAFELANAGAGAFEGGSAISSLAGTGAGSAFELANAGAGAFEGGTALNSLAGTGAGSAFEAANAGATAMSDLGASELANAGASANTAANVANAGNAVNTANTVANAANAAKTLIDPLTGLAVAAGSNLLGNIANREGITDARNLINEYGARANDRLTSTYADARDLNAAGRRDLNNIFTNQSTNLNNIINAQAGVYGDTNRNLANNYLNLNTNLNNTINAQAGVYGDTNTALENTYKDTKTDLNNLYDEQVGYQEPYQNIGKRASTEILANTPYFTKQFGTADLNTELAPNYAFQLGQGQMANQRLGNMSGGALGGNALRGLQDYTQNYASGAYQNAFKNFQDQRSNIYNTLSNMANIGTTSSGQLVSLGNTLGGNLGSLSSNYGNARVSNAGQMQNAYNQYGSNLLSGSNAYAGNMVNNANTMQGAYNQYGSNLNNAANTFGSNLTNNYATGVNAANVAGLNAANLAVGTGSALATNATQSGANNATALSNLGNTALLGSMIKAT